MPEPNNRCATQFAWPIPVYTQNGVGAEQFPLLVWQGSFLNVAGSPMHAESWASVMGAVMIGEVAPLGVVAQAARPGANVWAATKSD